jgi:NADPH2:quinone reductase
VGSAAVQLARARGARVVATASTPDRLRVAERLGADLVLDRRDGDIADAVLDWTSGAGVDGVVDPLGGEVLSGSLRAVRPRGGVVALGQAAGPWPDVPLAQIVGRNLSLHGLDLGRLARLAPHALRAAGERLCDRASAGALSPVVGARFALEDAGAAHALIERGGHAGKVVLETARG